MKPTKELLWVEKHLENEDSLEIWRKDNEDSNWKRFDDFDRLVTIALKREFPNEDEPFKIEAVNNTEDFMQPVDVTDEFKAVDVTESMRE